MIKQPQWKFLGAKRLMGAMPVGGIGRAGIVRSGTGKGGFREYGIKTYHFEYTGQDKKP